MVVNASVDRSHPRKCALGKEAKQYFGLSGLLEFHILVDTWRAF